MIEEIDPSQIKDEATRQIVIMLLNLVEAQRQALAQKDAQIQELRDEINRLKGEQGKPKIRPQSKPWQNISSEKERHQPKKHQKDSKQHKIEIDREELCKVDPTILPADAEFKGHEKVVVQELSMKSNNVLFSKEKFYSPGEHKIYLASLPRGYEGQFGPYLKSFILSSYFEANISEPKIEQMLLGVGIVISHGEISGLIATHQTQIFAVEKEEILFAGLQSSDYQQIDTTTTRVGGQNHYCQVVCNPFYTTYHTGASKERTSVIRALLNGEAVEYLLDESAFIWLEQVEVASKWRVKLEALSRSSPYSELELEQILNQFVGLGEQTRNKIKGALALAFYQAQVRWPVPSILVVDDAPEFKLLGAIGLCWVHEARHYKKLMPKLPYLRKIYEQFMTQFWDYYEQLKQYRQKPTIEQAVVLGDKFETIFAAKPNTGYQLLDERISLSWLKKHELLLVLEFAEIPLHNNAAELAVRARVRKRDVSFGPRSPSGAKSWDILMSIVETAHKLGVSAYAYIYDRLSGTMALPSLASLISQRASLAT